MNINTNIDCLLLSEIPIHKEFKRPSNNQASDQENALTIRTLEDTRLLCDHGSDHASNHASNQETTNRGKKLI
jgi:hypothetical protein